MTAVFTERFLFGLLIGTAFLMLGDVGLTLMLVYDGLIILLWLIDYVIALLKAKPVIVREINPRIYLQEWSTVQLEVENKAAWVGRVLIKHPTPDGFQVKPMMHSLRLSPKGKKTVDFHVFPEARGEYIFTGVYWRVQGFFGLAQIQGKTQLTDTVRVYPEIQGIHRFDLARRKRQWTELGFHHTRLKGDGFELRELREYQPGDDLRKIDWKVTARMGYPITREYEPERGQNLFLLLDAGRLMENRIGTLSRFDHALSASLALAFAGLQQGDRVGLVAFADEVINYVPPAKGREHLPKIVQALYGLQPAGVEADYGNAFRYLLTQQKKSGIVCLFTELVDEESSRQLLNRLGYLARHHRPICVTLNDPVFEESFKEPVREAMRLYQQGTSLQILRERERAKAVLTRQGVSVLDVSPEKLSVDLIARYLELKNKVRF
jgi:uncharacterized protein (DUF58 family)